ncbi:predicted protein [Naegleria gruberi]|uniref:Predicted protein n=1 Tax=Naegleria gruberi TaxID=5762 RepID=D2VB18_NAEGR|nr:uncharacterized protein NAEGRDRAFT_66056 [Naegleria gruberi]EFC46045.1 predicted protein [Naegleria gruberi]|eukprot:XP_002678789.1 predicted protein [Naegleria gruberi strain NEG-M]
MKRRRILHLKLYDPSKLPLTPNTNSKSFEVEKPIFVHSNNDSKFIEGCEWIYKCPLKYEELSFLKENSRLCKECSKVVYFVNNIEDFTEKIEEGKCVAYQAKVKTNYVIHMGRKCF